MPRDRKPASTSALVYSKLLHGSSRSHDAATTLTVRSRSMIALATTTSGVAASILPGGRTSRSRFKIPIELHENSFCSISKRSCLAELLHQAKLIIWERFAIEAVARTLQDLVGNNEPFGVKVVVLGGDFRQV
ncbi:uncharacterized protein [Henckelia pumila]|uniref:uncharacterized protein n=1 Tax=Henckelia pumila TaxID=405737 RepID=UPI003C6E978D